MPDYIGRQLGNYHLLRLLGRGGFAEVYLGEHRRLKTHAAIKVLHTQLAESDVEGFLKEAQFIASLEHPHIVRILDFDVEGSTPFLVMSYAPNGTLRQLHPKDRILPLTTVVSYVKQVADALQYAHDEKLIHRDIKPENMLLGRRNEILLSDFGIALVAQSSRYQSTQEMVGTMAYMPPEQIQGRSRPASDQYALGVVVYEWLTGVRPFHGSAIEIVAQHLAVAPTPLREKVPTISHAVQEVVLIALAKDPKERFGSVQAFANALEQASQLDAPTFVKPRMSMVQHPRVETPSKPTAKSEVTPSPPLTELAVPIAKPAAIMPSPPPKEFSVPSQPVGTILNTYCGHSDGVYAVAWSPDGEYIASGGVDRTVQVWRTSNGQAVVTYRRHSEGIHAVAWSPDGKYIASASLDKTVKVLDVTNESEVMSYSGHSDKVYAVAWSPDGKRISSGSWDGTVHIWNAATGERVFTFRGHSDHINAVAWSPDGKYIASGGGDKKVHMWNATTGEEVFTFRSHSRNVYAVAWSPDGKYIVSGGFDKIAQMYDATTGENIFTYMDHSERIYTLAWSPDGKRISSGSWDGTVHIWNAATGERVFTFRGHSDHINAVAWSPDSKCIASGSRDKTVYVWQAP